MLMVTKKLGMIKLPIFLSASILMGCAPHQNITSTHSDMFAVQQTTHHGGINYFYQSKEL